MRHICSFNFSKINCSLKSAPKKNTYINAFCTSLQQQLCLDRLAHKMQHIMEISKLTKKKHNLKSNLEMGHKDIVLLFNYVTRVDLFSQHKNIICYQI